LPAINGDALAADIGRCITAQGGNEPTDFASAYSLSNQQFALAQTLTEKTLKLKNEGKLIEARQQQEALKGIAAEGTRLMTMALQMAGPNEEKALVDRGEMMVAVGFHYQQKQLESAAMAEWFLRSHADEAPDNLRFAGTLALTALYTAYIEAPESDRDFERKQIIKLATNLAERWPGTELAVEATLSAGNMFLSSGEYVRAAELMLSVPESSEQFATAQLKAGTAYLSQYDEVARMELSQRPPTADVDKWKSEADRLLQRGVDELLKITPSDQPGSNDLILGKIALARVRNLDGLYKTKDGKTGAIELLTSDPQSPEKAVAVPEGEERPNDTSDIKHKQYAMEVYQLLLRSYIGAQNIEQAREAKTKLEALVDPEDAAALTGLYVGFGRQLEEELKQLAASGETERANEVKAGFKDFLIQLLSGDESAQDFNSLKWIGTTYSSLGEGSAENDPETTEYFAQAVKAYQKILNRAETNPSFVGNPTNIPAVQLRMIGALVKQQNYAEAEKILTRAMETPEVAGTPNIQLQAAELYTQWAESGEVDKFTLALQGNTKSGGKIWGWGDLSKRLRAQLENDNYRDLFHEATFNQAQSYYSWSSLTPEENEKKRRMSAAQQVLEGFARTVDPAKVPESEWTRFDGLYGQVLRSSGQTERTLRETADGGLGTNINNGSDNTNSGLTTGGPTGSGGNAEATPDAPSTSGNLLMVVVLLALCAGGVAAIFMLSTGQAKARRKKLLAEAAAASASRKPVKKRPPNRPAERG